MTDTATTPATEAEQEAVQVGFSYVELLYMTEAPGEAQPAMSRALMGLADPSESEAELEKLIAIGGSTLTARNMVSFTDDGLKVLLADDALFVSYVLSNAQRWTKFESINGAAGDVGFLIESALGSVLAQPRAMDTWWFIFLTPDASSAGLIADSAIALASQGKESAVFVHVLSLDYDYSFTIHHKEPEWAYAHGTSGNEVPDARVENTDQTAVVTALRSFIDGLPEIEVLVK